MYSVSPKVFRYCVVPQCENTTIETPNKMFISLPRKGKLRDKWLKLARRDPNSLRVDSRLYFCEDHFDLPRDMRNYNEYCMGYALQIQLRKCCLPSKFECQTDKRNKQKDLQNVKSYQGSKKVSSAKSTTTIHSIHPESSGAADTNGALLEFNLGMHVVNSSRNMASDKYCFCCLSYKSALISTLNCRHYGNYKKYMHFKNLNNEHHICVICHEMLKKIEKFNNMVIESNHIIASKMDIVNSCKKEFVDLQISASSTLIETVYHVSISTEEMEADDNIPVIKKEIIDDDNLPVIKQVKITDDILPLIKQEIVDEPDNLNDDNCLHYENIPVEIEPCSNSALLMEIEILPEVLNTDSLLSVKQEMEEISPQCEGKVRYICLTREEFDKEREKLESTDQFYRSSEFKCKSCVIGFPSLNEFHAHLNLEHDYGEKLLNKVQCPICDLFVNPPLVEHERTHFSRLECCVCNWRCKDLKTILQHYSDSHADKDKQQKSRRSRLKYAKPS